MTSVRDDGLIEFHFYRPNAASVSIAGDFNGWLPDDLKMRPTGDGWWGTVLRITPGEYRFCYNADGEWFADYAANGVETDRRHGWNSILIAPEAAEAMEETEERAQRLRMAA